MTEGGGLPIALTLMTASDHDSVQFEGLIARRKRESSERLGRVRWVVETTQPHYP